MSKIYKWLYTRIGGRPWTFIIRDSYEDHPLIWIISLLGFGSLFGTLLGHIFW